MAKAYVDTTVLTDALLKVGPLNAAATAAIQSFTETQLPVYAIKEFKAGPLTHFVYFHNKLVETNSYVTALQSLARLAATPQRAKLATSIEALATAENDIAAELSQEVQSKYGASSEPDRVQCDVHRLALKRRIFNSWRNRRGVTTSIVLPLSCYAETGPVESRNGLIGLPNRVCPKGADCCLRAELIKEPDALQKLRNAIDSQDPKRENQKRAQVLRKLKRTPDRPISDNECRNLGDAVFAFFAPADAKILTTNVKDHEPLAQALGKSVQKP